MLCFFHLIQFGIFFSFIILIEKIGQPPAYQCPKNCENEVNFIGNAMGTPDAFLQTYFSKFTQMKKRQLFY